MAKASIELPNGTKIVIEGDAGEVERLVAFAKGVGHRQTGKTKKRARSGDRKGKTKMGPTDYIRELVEDGFFKEKRSLKEIREALKAKGHIYASPRLSPILLAFTRKNELTRAKEGRMWRYAQKA